MSISVELPPAVESEVREYVSLEGTTLDRLFLDYLKMRMERRRRAAKTVARRPGALKGQIRMSEHFDDEDATLSDAFETSQVFPVS